MGRQEAKRDLNKAAILAARRPEAALAAIAAHPRAINSCDVIVGSYGPFGDADRAFVWSEAQGFQDLNDLVAPHPGWTLQAATAINEVGEIVGWAEHNHEDAGFLLIPKR